VAPPRFPHPSPSVVRRSLTACTGEGTAAEVVGACCGGAVLTGWALYLGMSAKLVGLLAALPVVAQLVQAVAAHLTVRFGHRRVALVSIALSRQAFLPLVFLPVLPLTPHGRKALLLASAGAYQVFGMVANNAWNTWMGELVPSAVRGRYFGRRTAFCTVAGGLSALLAGVALDVSLHRGCVGAVLEVLAAITCVAGATSVFLMSRQHADRFRPPVPRFTLGALLRPLADSRARRLLAYFVAWNGACGLSAPFFGLYLLRDLRFSYVGLAAQGAGLALAKMATTSSWGRTVDRLGSKRVLIVCTAGLSVSPLAWIASSSLNVWPLVLETAVGGVLLGGHAVASFEFPLKLSPVRERPFYLAAVAVAGGGAFALTSAVGGAVAVAAPVPAFRVLLASSACLRLVALLAAFALPGRRSDGESALAKERSRGDAREREPLRQAA
jgi:MFS family permease